MIHPDQESMDRHYQNAGSNTGYMGPGSDTRRFIENPMGIQFHDGVMKQGYLFMTPNQIIEFNIG